MKNPWLYRVKLNKLSRILTSEFAGCEWNDDLTEKIIERIKWFMSKLEVPVPLADRKTIEITFTNDVPPFIVCHIVVHP